MNKKEEELVKVISNALKSTMNELKKEIADLKTAMLLLNDKFVELKDHLHSLDQKINRNIVTSVMKVISLIIIMLFLYLKQSPIKDFGSLIHLLHF